MNTSIFFSAIFIHREPFCLLYLFVKERYQRPFKDPDFTPSLINYNNNYCYSLWSKALPDLSVDLEVR